MKKTVTRELSSNTYVVRYAVGPNQNGIRLDRFLMEHYRKRSREKLKRAIDDGAITVARNQGPHLTVGKLKPASPLVTGDEVLVVSERRAEPPVNFDYGVLREDDVLFVVDKPANLPVHPSGRFFFHTLLIHLKTQAANRALTKPLESDELFYLAHRIDKETSGILALTKDAVSCANLVAQFAARKTEKRYLAIVKGNPPAEFDVDQPLARALGSKISLKMAVTPVKDGGQVAQTRFRTLETVGNFALIEAFPKTGRQHQIRVHAEFAGYPLVGDKLYGVDEEFALLFYDRDRLTPEAEARLLLPRHALHAASLAFAHPTTGARVSIESPLPPDLAEFLDTERKKAAGIKSPGELVKPLS